MVTAGPMAPDSTRRVEVAVYSSAGRHGMSKPQAEILLCRTERRESTLSTRRGTNMSPV